jgi:hypothetical protein
MTVQTNLNKTHRIHETHAHKGREKHMRRGSFVITISIHH